MFEPIKERLHQRLEQIAATNERSVLILRIVHGFVRENYPDATDGTCRVSYDAHEREVAVVADSKAVARDLLLRAGQLSALFRKNGLKVSRLVIR